MNIKIWPQALLILLLINAPQQIYAEVIDKEPILIDIWAYALIGSLVCFLSGQIKWWIPILIFPIAIALPLGTVLETLDPHLGPVIFNEAGWSYVLQAYGTTFLVFLSLITGVIMGRRKFSIIKPKPESS